MVGNELPAMIYFSVNGSKMHVSPKSGSVSQRTSGQWCSAGENRQDDFNDVSSRARAFKEKQLFMLGCVINGFDFEKYLGTGPNQAERPRDCKLIWLYSTWSGFQNWHYGSILEDKMNDWWAQLKVCVRVSVAGCSHFHAVLKKQVWRKWSLKSWWD